MPPLDERISLALTSEMASADLAQLLAEIENASADSSRQLEQARETALDPMTAPDEIRGARAAMGDAEFQIDRLARAKDRIATAHKAAIARERDAERDAEYASAKQERDQLAADLAADYPEAANKIQALMKRIVASNARIEAVNATCGGNRLDPVEIVARPDTRPDKTISVPDLLIGVRLPSFEKSYVSSIWPEKQA